MKRLALLLALSACSPTYHLAATHARHQCAPQMLVDLDFAATLALLTASALAFSADHRVRASLEATAAVSIAVGSTWQEATCRD